MEDRNIVVRIGRKEFDLGAVDLDTQRNFISYLIVMRRGSGCITADENEQYDGVLQMYDAISQAAGIKDYGLPLRDTEAMKDVPTTLKDWNDAEMCQNACNASGLMISLFEMMPRLWHDIRHHLVPETSFSQHPILQMFLAQILNICTGQFYDFEHYAHADAACKAKIAELEAQKQ